MRIFCEGNDDKEFIIQLLQHLEKAVELNSKPEYSKYIDDMGGKSKLLNIENYSDISGDVGKGKITKVLFIFDADFAQDDKKIGGLENSEKSIKSLIKALNWNIEVDYYIFDKNLDDFILNTLDNKANFKACEQCFKLKKLNKNRKILTCVYQKLYPQNPYDFSHKNFDTLKQKLINLFK